MSAKHSQADLIAARLFKSGRTVAAKQVRELATSHHDLLAALRADEDALQLSPERFHAKHGWNVSELAERRRAAIEKAEK
jgi:hypothetical protein